MFGWWRQQQESQRLRERLASYSPYVPPYVGDPRGFSDAQALANIHYLPAQRGRRLEVLWK